MESLKILQIVGFRHSGKTMLIKNLAKLCKEQNKEVAVIKHLRRQKGLQLPPSKTESIVFYVVDTKVSLLEQLIDLTRIKEPSILYIEGFEEADYPKVVLIRNYDEWQFLNHLSNVVLIIWHDYDYDFHTVRKPLSFSRIQTREINNWFKQWMNE
ncbi:molybdopterin-guanine dinucleotide biosynthesis protein MobB [Ureibacillus sp. MALMAid1270]|uniref:molybdopterin-guanine dinucleotide biosynthesis protein MobB n=1 Tax=Ureibacillus sp. MALMAid1270 TaxID=3411629 RepID=UPI003BA68242